MTAAGLNGAETWKNGNLPMRRREILPPHAQHWALKCRQARDCDLGIGHAQDEDTRLFDQDSER